MELGMPRRLPSPGISLCVAHPCHSVSLSLCLRHCSFLPLFLLPAQQQPPTSQPLPALQVPLKPECLQKCRDPRAPWLRLPRPCSWAIPEDPTGLEPFLPGDGNLSGCASAVRYLCCFSVPYFAWESRPWMPTASCGNGFLQATPPWSLVLALGKAG